jgi:hypothetical protein
VVLCCVGLNVDLIVGLIGCLQLIRKAYPSNPPAPAPAPAAAATAAPPARSGTTFLTELHDHKSLHDHKLSSSSSSSSVFGRTRPGAGFGGASDAADSAAAEEEMESGPTFISKEQIIEAFLEFIPYADRSLQPHIASPLLICVCGACDRDKVGSAQDARALMKHVRSLFACFRSCNTSS